MKVVIILTISLLTFIGGFFGNTKHVNQNEKATVYTDESHLEKDFAKDKRVVCIVKGTRVDTNGEGLTDDGYYIAYPKGKIGTRFVTTFLMGETSTDFVDRLTESEVSK